MSPETETVLDMLQAVDDPATWKLEEVADPVADVQPKMDYEDWVLPMKLTGGRVCLRCDWGEHTWFYQRASNGTLWFVHDASIDDDPHPAGPGDIEEDLRAADVDVTPVLRRDTPFGEVEDG